MKTTHLKNESGYSCFAVEADWSEVGAKFGEDADSLRTMLQKGGGWQRLKHMLNTEGTLTDLMERNQAE